jgi:Glycosyl hydrolase family 76
MMSSVYLIIEDGSARFSARSVDGAIRIDYAFRLDAQKLAPERVSVEPQSVIADFGRHGKIFDSIKSDERGKIITILRRWALTVSGNLRVNFGVTTDLEPIRWVVPSVMYDGNRIGSGSFPRGGAEVGWSFREDRCSLPSATIVADDRNSLALATEPASREKYLSSCTTRTGEDGLRLSIEIPFVERPYSYRRKFYWRGEGSRARYEWIKCDGTFDYERCFYLRIGHGGSYFYEPFVREMLDRTDKIATHQVDWAEVLRNKAEHVLTNHYIEWKRISGFLTYVDKRHLPLINSLQAGFLGKNIEIALSLYRIGLVTGNRQARDAAIKTADFFLGGRIANGLLFTDYQVARGRWVGLNIPYRKAEVNTRTMGEAAWAYLRLHKLAVTKGEANPQWLETAQSLASFFRDNLPENGNPGKWWTVDGTPSDSSSTNGAYLVPVLLRLAEAQSDQSYLETAVRIGDFYLKEVVETEIYAGDTLDADCIDKEAGHAILRAMLALYRATGESRFLSGARRAAAYVTTWIFGYDVPYAAGSKLSNYSFHTTGATSVSVAHHHLDPYGIAIAVDYLDLAEITGDKFWSRLARRLIDYCKQLNTSEEDTFGYSADYLGHQPEQVVHTDWAYYLPAVTPRGSFFSNILWVPALTMGAILDLRAKHPDVMNFEMLPLRERSEPPALDRAMRRAFSFINFVA